MFFWWAAPNWNLIWFSSNCLLGNTFPNCNLSWVSSKEDWKGVLLNLCLFRVFLKNIIVNEKLTNSGNLVEKKGSYKKYAWFFLEKIKTKSSYNEGKKWFSWRKWNPSHHIMREKNGVLGVNEAQVDWHVVRFGWLMWWMVTIPLTWQNLEKTKSWLWT